MKSKATFNVEGSFKLSGRGLVINGDIVDGTISNGNFISFLNEQEQLKIKIKSVDFLDNIQEKNSKVGLTFYYGNDNEREKLEKLHISKQTAMVSSD